MYVVCTHTHKLQQQIKVRPRAKPSGPYSDLRRYAAKRSGGKNRLLIYDSLFRHTHIVRKLTFLGVQTCGCVGIGYLGDRNIRARSLKNGSILYAYEDFELRNEVTVTFPIEGIFQKDFYF